MPTGKFVAYYRVSTEKQGRSGLGLEAQRQAVQGWLNGGNWSLVAEYTETESGGKSDRQQLQAALRACRVHGATLVIAKLDRLSRDAHFLLGLQKSQVRFVAVDMPEANEMVVGIMAVVAQAERKMISDRTKAALQAAKTRGTVLGGWRGGPKPTNNMRQRAASVLSAEAQARAADLAADIEAVQADGITSANAIAKALNARGIPTPSKVGKWYASTVQQVLRRLPAAA